MRTYSITALDADGNSLYHETTDKSYYLTDLMYHVSELSGLLISGKAKTILIEEVKDGKGEES